MQQMQKIWSKIRQPCRYHKCKRTKEEKPADPSNAEGPEKEDNLAVPASQTRSKRKHSEEEDTRHTKEKIQKEVTVNQSNYNSRMKLQRRKPPTFRTDEQVSIKIDKVDKTSPLHPNVLIGKMITIDSDYAKIVTKFGRVKHTFQPTD